MNRIPLLFLNVFIIAVCGLVYELLAGTLASYVLGDSVTQFSLIIGLYLSALGVGAWLSRYLDRDLAARFIEVELAVALIGGLSAPLLFFGFARLQWFQLFLFLIVFVIGAVITPTPDPFNQTLVAIPMYLLWELGLLLSRFVPKRQVAV